MTHHQQSWLVRLADRDARQSRLVGHSIKKYNTGVNTVLNTGLNTGVNTGDNT